MTRRHTIAISDKVYSRLKSKGQFGESYTKLVDRILDSIDKLDTLSVETKE